MRCFNDRVAECTNRIRPLVVGDYKQNIGAIICTCLRRYMDKQDEKTE